MGPLAAWGITEGDWTSVWQAVIVVGDPPDGTVRGKFGVREREKMIELAGLEAADAKVHE